jgi:molybdopterin synthase sulfur carrier subunit
MKVKVLYFALYRELAGLSEEIIELDDGSTTESMRILIKNNHPDLMDQWPMAIISVNKEYSKNEVTLNDGDEVAIFPPISGG